MNQLITKSLLENNIEHLIEFPKELLDDFEIDLIDFIFDYYIKYDSIPTVYRLMDKFDYFIPYEFIPEPYETEEPPIKLVYEETKKRKLFHSVDRLNKEFTNKLKHGTIDENILTRIQLLTNISDGIDTYTFYDRTKYIRESILPFPLRLINRHIGGLSQGDFFLIAGRLGMGKSTLIQFIAKHYVDLGKKILYISTEVLSKDVFSRVDAIELSFNPLLFREPRGEIKDLIRKSSELATKLSGQIYIPKKRLLDPSQIGSLAKSLMVDLIIIDGIYLLRPNSYKGSSKWEKTSAISNETKQTALDNKIPIIATTQIKRDAGKELSPEDLSFSDSLGQDADFILAISQSEVLKTKLNLELIKNRFGEQCSTRINIDFDKMSLVEESLLEETLEW